MESLKNQWFNFLNAGLTRSEDPELVRKSRFINSFSLIGISILLIFGIVNVLNDNRLVGLVEFSFGVILVINLILFRNLKSILVASSIMAFSIMVPLLYLLVYGGIANSGILWFFTYPIVTFLIMGRKLGVVWLGVLFGVVIFMIFQHPYLGIEIAYSETMLRQLLISLFVVSSLIFVYQHQIEKTQIFLEQKNIELEQTKNQFEIKNKELEETEQKLATVNGSLEEKIKERTKELEQLKSGLEGEVNQDQLKLEEKIEQLEKTNKYMIDRELKMVELKKENALLRDQLGVEKNESSNE